MSQSENTVTFTLTQHQEFPEDIASKTHIKLESCNKLAFKKLLEILDHNPQITSLEFTDGSCTDVLPMMKGNKTIKHLTMPPAQYTRLDGVIEHTKILHLTLKSQTSTESINLGNVLDKSSVIIVESGDRSIINNQSLIELGLKRIADGKFFISNAQLFLDNFMRSRIAEVSKGLFANIEDYKIAAVNIAAIDAFTSLYKVGIDAETIKAKFEEKQLLGLPQQSIAPVALELLERFIERNDSQEAIDLAKDIVSCNIHNKELVSKTIGFFIIQGFQDTPKEIMSMKGIELDWVAIYKHFRMLPCDRLDDVELAKDGTLLVKPKTHFPISRDVLEDIVQEALSEGKEMPVLLSEKGIIQKGEEFLAEAKICQEKYSALLAYKELAGIIMDNLDLPHHPEYLGVNFADDDTRTPADSEKTLAISQATSPRMSVELTTIAYNILKESNLSVEYINKMKEVLLDTGHFTLEEGMQTIVDAIELSQGVSVVMQTNPDLLMKLVGQTSGEASAADDI